MKKKKPIKNIVIESQNVISDLKMYTQCRGFTFTKFYTSILGKKRILLSDGEFEISLEVINTIKGSYQPRKYFEIVAKTYKAYEELVGQLNEKYNLLSDDPHGFSNNYCSFDIEGIRFFIISKQGIFDGRRKLLCKD